MICDSWECVGSWFGSGGGAAWAQAILTVIAVGVSVRVSRTAINFELKQAQQRQAAEDVRELREAYRYVVRTAAIAAGVKALIDSITQLEDEVLELRIAMWAHMRNRVEFYQRQLETLGVERFPTHIVLNMIHEMNENIQTVHFFLSYSISREKGEIGRERLDGQADIFEKCRKVLQEQANDISAQIDAHAAP